MTQHAHRATSRKRVGKARTPALAVVAGLLVGACAHRVELPEAVKRDYVEIPIEDGRIASGLDVLVVGGGRARVVFRGVRGSSWTACFAGWRGRVERAVEFEWRVGDARPTVWLCTTLLEDDREPSRPLLHPEYECRQLHRPSGTWFEGRRIPYPLPQLPPEGEEKERLDKLAGWLRETSAPLIVTESGLLLHGDKPALAWRYVRSDPRPPEEVWHEVAGLLLASPDTVFVGEPVEGWEGSADFGTGRWFYERPP